MKSLLEEMSEKEVYITNSTLRHLIKFYPPPPPLEVSKIERCKNKRNFETQNEFNKIGKNELFSSKRIKHSP